MIALKQVSKVFKGPQGEVHALDHVDLTINKSSIYGIIGLSGAGKSTLIRCLNQLEQPTSGQILVGDQDICTLKGRELRDFRKKVGMIFQGFNLLSSRTVFENVSLALEFKGLKGKEAKERVLSILKRVGLEDKVNSPIAHLSGGQKQRVAIARALVGQPDILLCDEATSALDPKTTQEILDLIKELRQELNLTVVLITHEMSVIEAICDQVACLDQGRVVSQGPVHHVLKDASLFSKSYEKKVV